MGLDTVFRKAAETVFNIFSSLVKPGRYVVRTKGSGWDTVVVDTSHNMDVIVNGLNQEDKKNTSFFSQIQPSDTIVMIKGLDILASGVVVSNSDLFEIDFSSTRTGKFTIIAHETDPAEALFTLLLRGSK